MIDLKAFRKAISSLGPYSYHSGEKSLEFVNSGAYLNLFSLKIQLRTPSLEADKDFRKAMKISWMVDHDFEDGFIDLNPKKYGTRFDGWGFELPEHRAVNSIQSVEGFTIIEGRYYFPEIFLEMFCENILSKTVLIHEEDETDRRDIIFITATGKAFFQRKGEERMFENATDIVCLIPGKISNLSMQPELPFPGDEQKPASKIIEVKVGNELVNHPTDVREKSKQR